MNKPKISTIFKYGKITILAINLLMLYFVFLFIQKQVLVSYWETPEDLITNSSTAKKGLSEKQFDEAINRYKEKRQPTQYYDLKDIFY